MADGALTITIPDIDAARIVERAEALGVTPEALALQMFSRMVDDGADLERPATASEDFDGPYIELEDALTEFSAELERRLAARAE
jgi:hypothetical protein